jgi:hypothetical protein
MKANSNLIPTSRSTNISLRLSGELYNLGQVTLLVPGQKAARRKVSSISTFCNIDLLQHSLNV